MQIRVVFAQGAKMIDDLMNQYARTSKVLGDERGYRIPIRDSQSLDTLLLSNYFIDHLSEKEMMELRQKRATDAEVIIADFLTGKGADVLSNLDNGNFTRVLSSSYFDVKPPKNNNENQVSFVSPIKLMASAAYNCLLKNNLSKKLLKNATSKEDYKSVLFFDYLYNELSKERRSNLENNLSDFESNLKNSTLLYIIQLSIPVIQKENKTIAKHLKELSSREEINLEDLQNYNQVSERRLPNLNFDADEESANLVKERTKLKGAYQDLVQNKVYKKVKTLEGRIAKIGEETESLDKKEILEKNDSRQLRAYIDEINHMEEFYKEAQIRSDEFKETTGKIKQLINHDLRLYDAYTEKITILNRGIKKIREIALEFKALNPNNANLYNSKIESADEIYRSAQAEKDNRYLIKSIQETTDIYLDFHTESALAIRTNISSLNNNVTEVRGSLEKNKGFFNALFKKPFLKLKLKKLTKQLNALHECENTLNKKKNP